MEDTPSLAALPGVLIGRLWPAKQAFVGLTVSKWLRNELLANLEHAVFQFTQEFDPSKVTATEFCESLVRFKRSSVQIRAHNIAEGSVGPLASGLLQAMPQGLDTSLVQLDMSSPITDEWSRTRLRSALQLCSSLAHLSLHLGGDGVPAVGFEHSVTVVDGVGSRCLSHLDLSGHAQLQDCRGMERLAVVCMQQNQLRHLRLSNCALRDGDQQLANMLKHCTQLELLDLSNNLFSDSEVKAVLASLGSSVTHLSLRKCGVRKEGAKQLAALLGRCSRLSHLDLGDNRLQGDGLLALAAAVQQRASLTALRLPSTGLTETCAVALAAALQTCCGLESLDLSYAGCGRSEKAMAALARCKLERLRELVMTHGSIVVEPLASALQRQQLPAITHLNLSHNDLGPERMGVLAAALPSCSRLRCLKLRDNAGGEAGASGLADSLAQCWTLTELDAGWNKMGSGGVGRLVRALRGCTALQRLGLDFNGIGDGGAAVVGSDLHGPALAALDLSDNAISHRGVALLAAGLPRCSALSQLALSSNRFGEEGAESLARLLEAQRLRRLVVKRCGIRAGGAGAEALLRHALPGVVQL